MYPYTYEEYRKEVFRRIKELKWKINLSKEEIEEIIKNDYNAHKYLYEHHNRQAMDKICNEVSGTISCLLMF